MAALRRHTPLVALAAAMALVWLTGWYKVLTLENIAANCDRSDRPCVVPGTGIHMQKPSHRAGLLLLGALLSFGAAIGAQADPQSWQRERWSKTDFSKHSVEWHEILSGGPPKDGIPSIDRPKFKPAEAETQLSDTEPVIGLELNGDARAYPLRILIWHEIANDIVGSTPVAVTYCPLCNSAIVFERRVVNLTLEFGTTGKLRNSDLVMYDRQTESWWQQFTGEAIVGQLTGQSLRLLPARLESFALFKERHPQGQVLTPENPSLRAYGRNPYAGYDSSARPFLYGGDLPKGINPMARVVVVRSLGTPAAVTLELLRREGRLVLDDVILTWRVGQNSALDTSTVESGRDVGNVIAQRRRPDGEVVDVPYDVTFAFVVHAFHSTIKIAQTCDRATEGSTAKELHVTCAPMAGR
jgi:hypothetical protein